MNIELEKDTLVARLHINHDNHTRKEFKEGIREDIKHTDDLPSGYGLLEGEGGWFPEDGEDEIEPKSVLEMWIDSEKELEAVRNFKKALENIYNQECVCLELRKAHIEH